MSKSEKAVDVTEVNFSSFDKALYGTLFAMSKVYLKFSSI